MENNNFNISQILNATSVKELDDIPEVQLIIYGPETHRNMIIDYNNMIAGYGTYNVEIDEKKEELAQLRCASGFIRLFKGKKIDETISVLEKEIEQIESDKKGLDVLVDEALKCIKRFEEEMKECTKRVLISTGLTVDKFIDAYNKKRRELIQSAKPAKKGSENESGEEPPQKQ